MLRYLIVVDELLCASERDIAMAIAAGDILSYLSIDPVFQGDRFDYVILGYHLNRFEPLPFASFSRAVLLRIDWTGRLPGDQLAQLLLDSLVLQS